MGYVQVNIGRGTRDEEMSAVEWKYFKRRVTMAIVLAGTQAPDKQLASITVATGASSYTYQDGTLAEEEAAYISLVYTGEYHINELRADLKSIGKVYGQEAIALITDSELIMMAKD